MLPDFPEVKAHVRGTLLRWAKQQVPHFAPLLAEVGRFRQHEGRSGHLVRGDKSAEIINYPGSSFGIEVTKDEMKRLDLDGLIEKFGRLAQQIAEAEEQMMFAKVMEAAESVGNVVSADGDFRPEHFLELLSKTEMNFSPETGEPVGHQFVLDPDTAAKVIPLMREWESDPAFAAEHRRVLEAKREEWRAREDRRKLVD